ncbi:hypothetical protein [Streptomyces boncukensis]|uniref:Lipoprotein n=1 Tax=Streptomyces boncukensis TaxID=2711219 RepID=A0A6G4WRU9_9ACTN|nr:hypothetical protein [Streptomyces boncukensis]NGO67360.1 hypothetical protein [Streptomyces boncukensis]
MRVHAVRAAVLAAGCAMVLALAANGCTGPPRPADAAPPAGASRGPESGPAAVFLARDACSTGNRQRVEEVGCDSERASAIVLARHEGPRERGPRCPERTDYVLVISERRPDADEDGDGTVLRGYACMRSLEPPHPGDPGGGGGPRTIVGDCVRADGRRSVVRETPCDARDGRHAPEYRVVRQVAHRDRCPPGTALYVDLGGSTPVGCAERV